MDNLQRLVEETFLLGALNRPPDRFDIVVLVSEVGIIPVHPDPEVFQNLGLSLDVFLRESLAVSDEPVYSDNILYVFFRG